MVGVILVSASLMLVWPPGVLAFIGVGFIGCLLVPFVMSSEVQHESKALKDSYEGLAEYNGWIYETQVPTHLVGLVDSMRSFGDWERLRATNLFVQRFDGEIHNLFEVRIGLEESSAPYIVALSELAHDYPPLTIRDSPPRTDVAIAERQTVRDMNWRFRSPEMRRWARFIASEARRIIDSSPDTEWRVCDNRVLMMMPGTFESVDPMVIFEKVCLFCDLLQQKVEK